MATRIVLSLAVVAFLLPACGSGKGGGGGGVDDNPPPAGSNDSGPPGTMPNPDGGAPIPVADASHPMDAAPPPVQTLWDKFMGNGAYEDVGGVATDSTGNVYYTGYFQGTVDFGSSLTPDGGTPEAGAGGTLTAAGGSSDIYLAKFDPNGNYLWAYRFGDNQVQAATGIAIDTQGNVVITGINEGTLDFGTTATTVKSAGLEDVFVAKFDPTGTAIWAKDYGDSQSQLGYSVAVDTTGNIALVGAFEGTINFGTPTTALTSAGEDDIYVAKLDPNGNALWSKSYGDAVDQYGTFVSFDSTGDVIMTGDYAGTVTVVAGKPLTSAGLYDVLLAKFDPNGNPLFAEGWGDPNNQTGDCVAVDATGNIVLSGGNAGSLTIGATAPMTAMDMGAKYLAKFDTNGNTLWAKGFGDGNVFDWTAVSLDKTGGPVVVGEFVDTLTVGTLSITAMNAYDIFAINFDPNGNALLANRYGAVDNQYARSVAVAPSGDINMGGYFLGKLGFTAGGGESATGNGFLYLVQFSP